LHYYSQCISFPEWMSLLTICLSPLIAHVVSGTPPVSHISRTRPKWHDYLCHYNPTSIIWRYAAITDRRIRAIDWNNYDLASSNAIFWTTNGWDGSEQLALTAIPYCVRLPDCTHVRVVSGTVLKTVITTLQGLGALYTLAASLGQSYGIQVVHAFAVDNIFLPLAILGLLRFFAATWLTEDLFYSLPENLRGATSPQENSFSVTAQCHLKAINSYDNLDPCLMKAFELEGRFKPPRSSWPSRTFRMLYLMMVGGIWVIPISYTIPLTLFAGKNVEVVYSMTALLVISFFLFLLTISFVLYCVYFFQGKTTTTIIPCISKLWYKVYTFLLVGYMVIMIIVACIETNKDPWGKYSS
ncbi:hypothetical protein CC80DRAFT_394753, partial [Byssothecium circinans]